MGRSWTAEEIADLKAKYPYMSNKELAELFNRTTSSINLKAYRLGLRKVRKGRGVEVNEDFFKKWSSEMAYIFGLIFADGSITIQHKQGPLKGVSFASKSEYMVKLVREVLESTHKIQNRLKRMNDVTYNIYNVYVTRSGIAKDLVRLGMKPRQTKDKITEYPKNIPDRYFWHFLRGFFDGNGKITIRKAKQSEFIGIRIRFSNANKKFIEDLQAEIFRHASLNSTVYKFGQRPKDISTCIYQVVYYRIDDCLILGNMLYKDKGRCFDKRRFQKFQKFKDQRTS